MRDDATTIERRDNKPLNILTLSTIWPSSTQPNLGVGVENRMRAVQETGGAAIRVVAPAPAPMTPRGLWNGIRGRGGAPRPPHMEKRAQIVAHHPIWLRPPDMFLSAQAKAYYWSVRGFVANLHRTRGPFDLIDAHGVYPVGVAARWIASDLGLPFAVTARASDIAAANASDATRAQSRQALQEAAALAAPSLAMRDRLAALDVPPEQVRVLRDGVNLDLFRLADQAERAKYRAAFAAPLDQPLLVSVGDLTPAYGHHLAIEAVAKLPNAHFRIVGAGELGPSLQRLIDQLGVSERINLLGDLPHRLTPELLAAADIGVIAGVADDGVQRTLECLACGAPVATIAGGGAAEILRELDAERRSNAAAPWPVADPTAASLHSVIQELLSNRPQPDAVRAMAIDHGWTRPVDGVLALFQAAVAQRIAAE
ncbi:MAG: glycosyltransferase [Rhodobacteraceae bacterium]|nr:glycosyltransferase [Paracoccaceae bacterium]